MKIEQKPPQNAPPTWQTMDAQTRIRLIQNRIEQITKTPFQNWTESTLKMFNDLAKYLEQNEKKWLLLIGNVGTGKTTMVKAMATVYNMTSTTDKFMLLSALNLSENYQQDNFGEICRIRTKNKILIDDIGTEPNQLTVYKNVVYPFADFIQHKYDDLKSVVILTTNLNSTEIRERYGLRVLDRLIEKCYIIKNEGKSLRH